MIRYMKVITVFSLLFLFSLNTVSASVNSTDLLQNDKVKLTKNKEQRELSAIIDQNQVMLQRLLGVDSLSFSDITPSKAIKQYSTTLKVLDAFDFNSSIRKITESHHGYLVPIISNSELVGIIDIRKTPDEAEALLFAENRIDDEYLRTDFLQSVEEIEEDWYIYSIMTSMSDEYRDMFEPLIGNDDLQKRIDMKSLPKVKNVYVIEWSEIQSHFLYLESQNNKDDFVYVISSPFEKEMVPGSTLSAAKAHELILYLGDQLPTDGDIRPGGLSFDNYGMPHNTPAQSAIMINYILYATLFILASSILSLVIIRRRRSSMHR